jgi:zinc protease
MPKLHCPDRRPGWLAAAAALVTVLSATVFPASAEDEVAAAVATPASPPATSTVADPAERTQVTTLENGLTVLTLVDHTTPVVSFQMWVRVGSRDETRYTGLAHLFEHMMFKGSDNVPPEVHAKLVQARGGRLNAFTSRDFTVYFEDVPPESLPLVIDLEAERLAHLDISERTLASEREVVLEERRMRTEDSPEGQAYETLLASAFVAHPYRWPVIGWRSDVEKATVAAAREFFDTYYAPNNIVISIVGDFDADATLEHVDRAFGKLAPAEVPRSPTAEPEQNGERRTTVYFDVRSPLLAAAWHAPPTGHADGPALDVLSVILSDGRSSRLYQNLVYAGQVALFAQGAYWELVDSGLFFAIAGVRPDADIADVERRFMAEIAKVRSQPVAPAELEKAKRQLEVSLVEGLRTSHALGSRIARDFATFGRIRPLSELLAEIQNVTAADVQRVAEQYLRDEKRSVVHVIRKPEDAS